MNPILWMFGYRILSAAAEERDALLDLCFREGISYTNFRADTDGAVSFRCSLPTAKRLLSCCRAEGISVSAGECCGIPRQLLGLYKRVGLWLGLAVATALLVFSELFVWSVEITGNEAVSSKEIMSTLQSCGFGVGSYIPTVRMGELENRVLLATDRISWISIHMDGTVAVVQVIEEVSLPEESRLPANLISSADGQIEEIELYRGNCVVKVGQAVKKGELLAGGVYDSSTVGVRYTRAAGRVLARTNHEFTVEIPLQYQKKVYRDPKIDEIVLNFFGFSIKIFKSSGKNFYECDIIRREVELIPLGRRSVPVSLDLSYRTEYTEETEERSCDMAERLAYEALERQMALLSEETQLLRKEVSSSLGDTSVTLQCRVACIENIAVQSEFEILEE